MKNLFWLPIILLLIVSCKKESNFSNTQEYEISQILKDSSVKKLLALNNQLLVNIHSPIDPILPLIKKNI